MTQKKTTAANKSGSKGPSLTTLRTQIDKLDGDILKLINDRAKLCVQIGDLKAADGVPVFSAEREDEILTRILESNKGPLTPHSVRAIFRELMSGGRELQQTMRIAYLGPEYSFSHVAAIERFGSSVEYIPVGSIAGVFEAVNRGQADQGLVPIENSTDGRIADTLDMFTKLPLRICGEVSLRVRHNLIARCPQSEIREVYSKPQALSQCRKWLATNVPMAQLREVASTSTAIRLVMEKSGVAAVGSRQAAVANGLNILVTNIEDRENNITRFAIIGHDVGKRTGNDKTTILLQIPNAPGALYDALSSFKKNRVNMTWIESFPAENNGKDQRYDFFIDVTGHPSDLRVKRTLSLLERRAERVVVVGAFPRGKCYE